MTRCTNATCSKLLEPQTAVNRGERLFCDYHSLHEWERTNDLFKYAAEGAPLWDRRPTRALKWWQR